MMLEASKKITGETSVSPDTMAEAKKEVKDIPSFGKKIEDSLTGGVTETLEIILAGAFILDASDIHVEPKEEDVKIRIRIDGILQDALLMGKKSYETLLSRIKLISGIKLNVSGRPQDGRFSILIDNCLIEIRTSTLPSEYGESIVLRILNPKSLYDLESLGLRNDLLETFKREIKKPNGMIIVTGPTGSGKTTTLYAFLKKIQNPEIKIITIEDPIEYHLKGVSQTQVDPEKGYTFSDGLRSIAIGHPCKICAGRSCSFS